MPRPQVSEELVDELDGRVGELVPFDVADLPFEQKLAVLIEEYDDLRTGTPEE